MWNRIAKWYNDWEQEQLDVLADPSLAAKTAPGYRRYVAEKLAELSPVERQQLRAFSIKYQGRTLYIAVAKFALLFSLCGVLLQLGLKKEFDLVEGLVVGNVFGFGLLMGFLGVWFNSRRMARHKFKLVAIIVGCATLGALVGASAAMIGKGKPIDYIIGELPMVALRVGVTTGAAMSVLLLLLTWIRVRQSEMEAQQLQAEAERERLGREVSESQLRLLRAQIEPHFLFNTLGAVQQLAEQGAPRAAELTANLIDFLRASMTEMRSDQVLLSSEFALVESYLKVMKTRLGDRLTFSVSLPEPLAAVSVPSMILLTLVENAIKHGIEPSLRGGDVTVSAHHEGDRIRIRVEDTGIGMNALPGGGNGLENVRRRLQLAHGDAAALELHDGHGNGFVADILIPAQIEHKVAA
ncbi:sensor histidine kinase [Pseudoduganella sp. GCM10020061]|uniref:sensor histidine kinase n=1 Tax=Pseudoduganella sp. GCM10020061 TaxID=3317345 RepID=UPI0036306B8D